MSIHRPGCRLTAGLALVVACLPLSGCVVYDIRDEIISTNDRLTSLEQRLDLIRDANLLLDGGNRQLEAVEARLAKVEGQLATLDSIDGSLKQLDTHLKSLRGTIANIGSAIPFLNIAGTPDESAEERAPADAAPPRDGTDASEVDRVADDRDDG